MVCVIAPWASGINMVMSIDGSSYFHFQPDVVA
jgi:hypothetical protein